MELKVIGLRTKIPQLRRSNGRKDSEYSNDQDACLSFHCKGLTHDWTFAPISPKASLYEAVFELGHPDNYSTDKRGEVGKDMFRGTCGPDNFRELLH
jgi:hypothetical protein